jgi:hypothetical protein
VLPWSIVTGSPPFKVVRFECSKKLGNGEQGSAENAVNA